MFIRINHIAKLTHLSWNHCIEPLHHKQQISVQIWVNVNIVLG